MKEIHIQKFWSTEYLQGRHLHTSDGKSLCVLYPGVLNENAGPDFLNAIIKLDGLTWYGNIEIHLNTSDWIKHKHSENISYDKIVLHVVYNNDLELDNTIPTLVLSKLVSEKEIQNEVALFENGRRELDISNITDQNLTSLFKKRLQKKEQIILKDLDETKNDWQEVFYRSLARAFGFSINAFPFEALSRSLPLSVLRKHTDNQFDIESLIFGQSSLLNSSSNSDTYCNRLKFRYDSFRYKYNLEPLDESLWKFARMRPLNFPTVRLAQFSSIMYNFSDLVFTVFNQADRKEIQNSMKIPTSEYWSDHYTFKKKSQKISKSLGKTSIDNIYMNSIVPFLSVFQKYHGVTNRMEKALKSMKSMNVEDNKLIRKFREKELRFKNALESQAIVELSLDYNV